MAIDVRNSMAPIMGNPPSIEWQPLDQLYVDPSYQRTVDASDSQASIRKIALAWDWRLCGLLMVSRREGRLFVIDGQHRLEAARGRGDIPHLPCVIASFEGAEQEAECFVAINTRRRPLTPAALFRAAIAAGDADAIAIDRTLASVGLNVTACADWRVWAKDEVPIIGTIRKFAARRGHEQLIRVLTILAEAFRGTIRRHAGILFSAIGALILQERVDDDLLIGVLAGSDADSWAEDFRHEQLKTGNSAVVSACSIVAAAYREADAE